MTKFSKSLILTSVDVGTTKISVLVARHTGAETVEILGCGKAPSEGLQRGVVVNVAKTVASIKAAIKEAEAACGFSIESGYIGISGSHIRSVNSHGVIPIAKGVVSEQDVAQLLQSAQAIPIPEGYQILHVMPQHFIIDGQDKLADPIGMHGIRLEASVHIILGAIASVKNLISCCEQAGLQVDDIILEPLASAQAVLSADECRLGVAMLDIGGGTSDFAVYKNGSIVHTTVLPVAGNHFTNDVAVGFCTSIRDAERVKREHGTVDTDALNEMIDVELAQGGHKAALCKKALSVILHARALELLHMVRNEIEDKQLRGYCTSGLVITGGGSLLNGLDGMARAIIGMPVRVGNVHASYEIPGSLESPIHATGYGLLLHAVKVRNVPFMYGIDGPFVKRVLIRMKSWVNDFF